MATGVGLLIRSARYWQKHSPAPVRVIFLIFEIELCPSWLTTNIRFLQISTTLPATRDINRTWPSPSQEFTTFQEIVLSRSTSPGLGPRAIHFTEELKEPSSLGSGQALAEQSAGGRGTDGLAIGSAGRLLSRAERLRAVETVVVADNRWKRTLFACRVLHVWQEQVFGHRLLRRGRVSA